MTIVAVAKLEGRQVYYCEACLLAYEDPALVCNCEGNASAVGVAHSKSAARRLEL